MRAIVLGIGNILLSDEGIGVHAVNELSARYKLPEEADVIDGGVSAMDCLDQIAQADLLLIADCMRSGREPGAQAHGAHRRRAQIPGSRHDADSRTRGPAAPFGSSPGGRTRQRRTEAGATWNDRHCSHLIARKKIGLPVRR
jgi:hypothetical protein